MPQSNDKSDKAMQLINEISTYLTLV